MGLRERWQGSKPEFLILSGAVVGFVTTYGFLAWTIVTIAPMAWSSQLGPAAVGLGVCVLIPVAIAWRPPRSSTRFAALGLLSTILALLNYPGILGGGIALVGAAWGILTTYGRAARN